MPSFGILKGKDKPTDDVVEVPQHANTIEDDKEEIVPDQDAQVGVQKIEAVTLVWTKKSLAALLIK
jgi:hypothetical protein